MQVRDLTELDLEHLAEYGGKAACLGHAARLGCPVLGGVAVSTRLFQRFAEQGGLLGEVASILNTMQPRTMAQFQAAAWAIRSAFQVRRLPPDVRTALVSAWERVGAEKVSVRSSATNEDSPDRSFIGQHVSTLNVGSADELVAAALESYISLFSAKSLAYAHRFGVDLLSSGMGLVVHPMIEAESRGALFTVDPITGDPDKFILEIHQGPERGVFDLDPYGRKPGELSYWSQLRYYGLLLDEHDCAYQAIEWAITGGELCFLRVRPATAVPCYLPLKERPANLSRTFRLAIGQQASARELQPFSHYHLSRLGLASAGLNQASRAQPEDSAQIQVLGYLYRAASPVKDGAASESGPLGWWTHGLRDFLMGERLDQATNDHVAALQARLASLHPVDVSGLAGSELADSLAELQRTGDALVDACTQMEGEVAALADVLRQMHQNWAHSDVDPARFLKGAQTDPNPAGDIGSAPILPATVAELLLYEFPAAPASAQLIDLGGGKEGEQSEPSLAVEAEQRFANELGLLQRSLYRATLERARRLRALLDEALAAAIRSRHLEQQAMIEAGRRLRAVGAAAASQDAVLLEARELDRWLRGDAQDEQVMRWIIRRREALRRAWRYTPPSELGTMREEESLDVEGCDVVLKGRAVSAGRVSGRARVIRSLGETSAVLPGEVLICHQATFELSPIFGIVAALVAETGTLLDHGSVLVREYGLPAVFAVADAIERIETGDEVVVDAVGGVVGRRRSRASPGRLALRELSELR